jgi:ClpP class serine protease
MSLLDLVFISIMVSSLQPLLQQRWLERQRLRAFRRLETLRKSRVIGLIHRQERMSLLGFPIARYTDIQDSEGLLRAMQLTVPSVPIDLILHTPGARPGSRADRASVGAPLQPGDGVRSLL